jgi:hypothetical protein
LTASLLEVEMRCVDEEGLMVADISTECFSPGVVYWFAQSTSPVAAGQGEFEVIENPTAA